MKRLATLFAAFAMVISALIMAPATEAAGTVCNSSEMQINIYANTGYSPDSTKRIICLVWTGAGQISVANLTQRPQFCYEQSVCQTQCPRGVIQALPDAWTWNDCISSVKFYSPSCHWGVKFYEDANYVTYAFALWGTTDSRSDLGTLQENDRISSMYRAYRSVCST